MPELPEVETVRRQLEPLVRGRRLREVAIDDPRLTRPEPPELVAELMAGRRVEALERRGKYLVFELEGELSWVVHLRMTGSFATSTPTRWPEERGSEDRGRHTRATVVLDDGLVVAYDDVRRFGTWALLEHDERDVYFDARLGPEPFDTEFDGAWLSRRLADSGAPVKATLLDQRAVAGVGNIYADEALWRAGLHPGRVGATLAGDEVDELVGAIRDALSLGIERQGATLRDYRAPNGASGSMQEEFAVYGREGEPCPRCASAIAKSRIAGRGTWFCPDCQRGAKLRA